MNEDHIRIHQAPIRFDWELVLAQLPLSMSLLPDDIHRERTVKDLLDYLYGERARLDKAEAKLREVLESLAPEA